jgi:hypothetical protein
VSDVKPETVITLLHVAEVNVPVIAVLTPAMKAVAVYVVIGTPPSDPGAVHVTVADVELATVAVPIVGAPGTTAVTEFDAPDATDVPTEFVAVTVNV